MNINGKWYTEPQIEAYVTELENKVAELEEKHWNECRQIARYDDELRKAKELLKAAVEDIRYLINYAKQNEKACDRCKYGNEMYCYADDCSNDAKWQHEAEALALIGEDTNVPDSADDTNVGHKSSKTSTITLS